MSERVTIGVDFKVREVSVAAIVTGDSPRHAAATKIVQRGLPIPNTLSSLAGRAEALVHHVLLLVEAGISDVHVAAVEQPGSHPHRPHPNLIMAQGVIMAKLVEMGMAVVPVPVTEWKKHAIGSAHAKKIEVQDWAAETYDFHGTEDECDSLAIAHATMLTAS